MLSANIHVRRCRGIGLFDHQVAGGLHILSVCSQRHLGTSVLYMMINNAMHTVFETYAISELSGQVLHGNCV